MTVLLIVVTAGYLYFLKPGEDLWFWGALAFFFLAGIVIGLKTQKVVTSKSNSTFYAGVMGGMGIRMLLSILFLAIYLVISEIKSVEFIAFYLILYLFYTIFEIYQLVHKLRAEKQTKVDNTTP
ncbi:MAG: hypothetical protein COA58_14170 [Bacteroidetes bacterium]|nr:MAG: hypothetical protein COA58_14170 [Bacteroidota bacterium]